MQPSLYTSMANISMWQVLANESSITSEPLLAHVRSWATRQKMKDENVSLEEMVGIHVWILDLKSETIRLHLLYLLGISKGAYFFWVRPCRTPVELMIPALPSSGTAEQRSTDYI